MSKLPIFHPDPGCGSSWTLVPWPHVFCLIGYTHNPLTEGWRAYRIQVGQAVYF